MLKKYFQYIRQLRCCVCGMGTWDMERGQWNNTVSHVKTKGSGGGDYGNCVPMCFLCHRRWEDSTKPEREQYLFLAQQIYQKYLTETSQSPKL